MFTIKQAARLSGVPEPTLRAWERRYAVVTPHRSPGNYRLYTDDDLRVLRTMHALVEDGWTAGRAADRARVAATGDATTGDTVRDTTEDTHLSHRQATGSSGIPTTDEVSDAAAVDQVCDTVTTDRVREFVAAAIALDQGRLETIVAEWFAALDHVDAITQRLSPAMRALGDGWARGEIGIGSEHLASAVCARALWALDGARSGSDPGAAPLPQQALRQQSPRQPSMAEHGTAVLGLPAGARHELGLLSFAATARSAGVEVCYLGADVPAQAWPAAVSDPKVTAAVLSVPCLWDVFPAAESVAAIRTTRPDVIVALGGAEAARVPADAYRLDDDLRVAVAQLTDLMSGDRPAPTHRDHPERTTP